MHKQILY